MPGRSLVCFSIIYKGLAGIMLKTRCETLGILGHSLRNKIPIVGNQGKSEVSNARKNEKAFNLYT
jgi:hypothetical protein